MARRRSTWRARPARRCSPPPQRQHRAAGRALPAHDGVRPQHRRDHRRSRSRASAGRGDDAAQFLVAIHRRTRRRAGVLAAVAARAARRTAGHGRRADRQQRTRTGPSRSRRVHRPAAGLGTRRAVGALGRQSRGCRRPADRDVGERRSARIGRARADAVRVSRRMCSRPQRRCRVARRATSIVPADAMSRWSAAIPGSICRRTAGRMRWTWTRWNASPGQRRGWWWR